MSWLGCLLTPMPAPPPSCGLFPALRPGNSSGAAQFVSHLSSQKAAALLVLESISVCSSELELLSVFSYQPAMAEVV